MIKFDIMDFDEHRGGCPSTKRLGHDDVQSVILILGSITEEFGLPDPGRYGACTLDGIATFLPHCTKKLYQISFREQKPMMWNQCHRSHL